MHTRAKARRLEAEERLSANPNPWLPEHLQLHVLEALLKLEALPEVQTIPTIPLAGVATLVNVQLVCHAWRAHVRHHPAALQRQRLTTLLVRFDRCA